MKKRSNHFTISHEESDNIQILKIWLTIMVIFIHSYTTEINYVGGALALQVPIWLDWIKYIISQIISRCAVPAFFFISAVLLYRKDFTWKDNIKKKIKTLLIPYLIFNTVWIIIYYCAQQISFLTPYFANEAKIIANWGIIQYADAYLGFINGNPNLYPLWFVRDLIVLNLLAVVIKKIIDKFPKIVFVILSIMILFNLETHLFFLKAYSLIFFCLGYYFVKYSFRFSDIGKIKMPYITIVYLIAIVLDCLTRNTEINYLPKFVTIICSFIVFYKLTAKIPKGKMHNVLLNIAKYSFPIYLFHEESLHFAKKILVKLLPQTALWQTILYFGLPIIIFCFCLFISMFLDKYFHKIYQVLVGSRSK